VFAVAEDRGEIITKCVTYPLPAVEVCEWFSGRQRSPQSTCSPVPAVSLIYAATDRCRRFGLVSSAVMFQQWSLGRIGGGLNTSLIPI
jgi:hypothetical protein